jgi:hypothetical protein
VAKVEIGLRPILQHVNFAVLERVHRPRIDIQIWIELLQHDLERTVFEQCSERRGGQPFPE